MTAQTWHRNPSIFGSDPGTYSRVKVKLVVFCNILSSDDENKRLKQIKLPNSLLASATYAEVTSYRNTVAQITLQKTGKSIFFNVKKVNLCLRKG